MTGIIPKLADPTNYGNKPGEGPLRPGGQSIDPSSVMVQSQENLPSTPNAAAKRQVRALELVRDLQAGAERVRDAGPLYLPRAPGEKVEAWMVRLSRSVFHNFFRRTVEGLTGLVFRKDPVLSKDVFAAIVEHWENIDNAGTHGDVWCRDIFFDALTVGHCAIFVEYPNTGEAKLTLAQESGLRPYWIHIKKDDIVSWRSTIEDGQEVLTQFVFAENTMVPHGEYGEKKQVTYRVLRRTTPENGGAPIVSFQHVFVSPQRTVHVLAEGTYPTQTEIPVAEVVTSGRVALFESVPPLLDVAYLNVAHYQQWSDYATSLHMTCVPILFGAGVQTRGQPAGEIVVGPNSAVWSPDPASRLEYVTHGGTALAASRTALDDLKSDMGTLGLAMLAPQKRAAETAEAKRLDKATSDSALSVAARGLQDAIERALQFHANYLRVESGGSITINRDFEGLAMDASVMSAYATLVRDAGFPARLVLEMLQQGGRIPEDTDLDALEMEMAAEAAAQAEREAQAREAQMAALMANNGNGEAEGESEESEPVAAEGNPYKVVKRGTKWVVVKADSGEVVKSHPTRAKALAHFKALEANVTD